MLAAAVDGDRPPHHSHDQATDSYSDADRERLEAQPLFRALPAVQCGSYVATTYDTALALAFPSVLSIPYGLTKTVPLIKQALAS